MATSVAIPKPMATQALCIHCQSPIPKALGPHSEFCCSGCETVYAILTRHGLDQYYQINDRAPLKPPAATGRGYEDFDDATFCQRYVRDIPNRAATKQVDFLVSNLHCSACIWLIEKLPRLVPGVIESRVSFLDNRVTMIWDNSAVMLSTIAAKLDQLGYPVQPYRRAAVKHAQRQASRQALIRLAGSGAVAIAVMHLSLILYAGFFEQIEQEYAQLFRWAAFVLSVPGALYGGWPFIKGASTALRVKTLHMDLPIAIGIFAGLGISMVNTIRGQGAVYFDTVTSLIFLLLWGRWLQQRHQQRAVDAADLLCTLTPSTASRQDQTGHIVDVPIEALLLGDKVIVASGQTIPVDGQVLLGNSSINRAILTGESQPLAVSPGDKVEAGTINIGQQLVILTTAWGEATRIGKLMQQVEQVSLRRAPVVQLADRFTKYFIAFVLISGAATCLWWLRQDPYIAFEHTLALLIVTCPCALGLATPLAVSAAIGYAAKRGLFIKGGDALQRLAKPGVMILDKTGTITTGQLHVVDYRGDETMKPIIVAIEQQSAHPIAKALVSSFANNDPSPGSTSIAISETREQLGSGMQARVTTASAEQHHMIIGKPSYVTSHAAAPSWVELFVQEATSRGDSPILIARDNQVVAAASLGDPIRPDAHRAIKHLHALNWRVEILSGDHEAVVHHIGRQLGLDPRICRGNQTPEDKLAVVTKLTAEQPTVMVGDGVNDAAALAAATCGIAVKGGAEACLNAADVFSQQPGLMPIVDAVQTAHQSMRTISQNIIFSMAYNVLAVLGAFAGWLNPLSAAILMPVSSLTVISWSYMGLRRRR